MTNYEIIKKYLEHGFNGGYVVPDEYPYYTVAGRRKGYVLVKRYADDGKWITEEKFNQLNITITPVYPPFKPYKKGDLVDVLETVKNMYGFESRREKEKEIVGRKGLKIDSLTNFGCYEINFNGYDFNLPHHVLAPHIPNTTPDTITIGGQKYSKQEVEDRLKDLKPVK